VVLQLGVKWCKEIKETKKQAIDENTVTAGAFIGNAKMQQFNRLLLVGCRLGTQPH